VCSSMINMDKLAARPLHNIVAVKALDIAAMAG